jgi:hypothetical protein
MTRAAGETVAVATGGDCGGVHGLERGGEGVYARLGFGGGGLEGEGEGWEGGGGREGGFLSGDRGWLRYCHHVLQLEGCWSSTCRGD